MPDQANDLRELVRQSASPHMPAAEARRIVVAGGKGGVGTTTVAVNLAAALNRGGWRSLLVDAAPGGDAAVLCRLDPRYTLGDVLTGSRTVGEAAQVGPGGILVLAGDRGPEQLGDCAPAALDRLLAQLSVFPRARAIVFDAGNSPNRVARRLWQAADLVLLVTTPSDAAVMDTYATIKLLAGPGGPAPQLLVNMAPNEDAAASVFRRLQQACQRFLALELASTGCVPTDESFAAATASGPPAERFDTLAQALLMELDQQDRDFALGVGVAGAERTSVAPAACRGTLPQAPAPSLLENAAGVAGAEWTSVAPAACRGALPQAPAPSLLGNNADFRGPLPEEGGPWQAAPSALPCVTAR